MLGVIVINNQDFENSFISILLQLGINDYKSRTYIINPIKEDNKHHSEFDNMMRNFVFPKKRKLSYEQFIHLFTMKEGYYPCWINIVNIDSDIEINTSLRMRKLKGTLCIGEYHPFKSDLL